MKKRIIFYRHGKSDWNAESQNDIGRPLSKRGVESARIMGLVLARSGQVPELAITSPAVRAESTLDISMTSGKWQCKKAVNDALYSGNAARIIQVLTETSDDIQSVMLVGHEPILSGMISLMTGGGSASMPTAAMARIDFILKSWRDLKSGFGTLRWLQQPAFYTKGTFNLDQPAPR